MQTCHCSSLCQTSPLLHVATRFGPCALQEVVAQDARNCVKDSAAAFFQKLLRLALVARSEAERKRSPDYCKPLVPGRSFQATLQILSKKATLGLSIMPTWGALYGTETLARVWHVLIITSAIIGGGGGS